MKSPRTPLAGPSLLVALVAVLAATLAGCGGDDGGSGEGGASGAPTACPSYADVTASPEGTEVTQTFVVRLDLSLMKDADARRALYQAVSDATCLLVTESGPAALDAVTVDTGIPLDAAGQRAVEEEIQRQEGVVGVEPTTAPDPL